VVNRRSLVWRELVRRIVGCLELRFDSEAQGQRSRTAAERHPGMQSASTMYAEGGVPQNDPWSAYGCGTLSAYGWSGRETPDTLSSLAGAARQWNNRGVLIAWGNWGD